MAPRFKLRSLRTGCMSGVCWMRLEGRLRIFVGEYASVRDGVVGMAVRRAYAVLELIERLS